jgi:hypothetical protein
MRPCSYYFTRDFFYIFSSESPHCKRCFRVNRQCKLIPSDIEIERLHKETKKLFNRTKETRAKAIRLVK